VIDHHPSADRAHRRRRHWRARYGRAEPGAGVRHTLLEGHGEKALAASPRPDGRRADPGGAEAMTNAPLRLLYLARSPQPAHFRDTSVRELRELCQKRASGEEVGSDRLDEAVGWSRVPGWHAKLIIRTLALLTRSRGAKLGANVHRHRATSGYVQRFSLRLEPTSGDTRRCQATLGNAS